MTILASDSFTRADQSTWGTASDGNTYTYGSSGVASTTNLTSNEGTTSGGNDLYAQIGTGTSAPVNVLVRCATNSNGTNIGLMGRYASSITAYRAYLHSQTFNLEKIVSGTSTSLSSGSFSYGANQFCWIRLICQGTTISASVWLDGNSEPGSPTLSVTDSSITTAGRYGIYFFPGGGTAQYDHLTVTDNAGNTISLVTQAEAKFFVKANMQTRSEAKFSVRSTQQTQARAKFLTRAKLGTTARSKFITRLALSSPAWVQFLVNQVIAPPTHFTSATWVTRDMQATWKTRDGKVTWKTRQ